MKQKTHKNEVKYNPFENVEIKKSNIDFSEITHYHKNPKDMVEASFLFKGNTQRMKKLMQKAKNGDKINFTVLGGSITEGSGHSDGEYYGDVLNKWFKENFKQSEICYVNSGRGTTTSLFGSARIQRDILPLNCDLVIVEYAVNDTILEKHIAREAFEGLLIKLLSLPSKPCVMILFSCMGG
ncbi:MAG: SGNH/GDSL hydrolase family protein, partial [Oscillospiraceae bacterium]